MPRYKAIIEYDGTDFSGWQRQKDVLSVQQLLEEAIERFSEEVVTTRAAGRTDAGVHAKGQVVHFDLSKDYPIKNIREGINFHLKTDAISMLEVEKTDEEFDARFSAKKRFYQYRIINRSSPLAINKNRAWHVREKLDIKKMQEAANILIGKHDFTSFRATQCQAKSPLKTLDNINITEHNEEILINFDAPSFLHHMVRNIVGTLKLVANGKISKEDVKEMLDAKDRSAAGPTAPAHGLYFMKVEY